MCGRGRGRGCFENGVDCFAARLDEGRVCCVDACGSGMETPSAPAGHLPRRGGGGEVEIGGVCDEVAEGGEGLGLEFFVDGVAAGGVDVFDVRDGAAVLVALGQRVELVERDGVDLADGDGRHGRVEEVFEEGFGEWRKRGNRDLGLGIGGRGRSRGRSHLRHAGA